jgi:hypothetical protein
MNTRETVTRFPSAQFTNTHNRYSPSSVSVSRCSSAISIENISNFKTREGSIPFIALRTPLERLPYFRVCFLKSRAARATALDIESKTLPAHAASNHPSEGNHSRAEQEQVARFGSWACARRIAVDYE